MELLAPTDPETALAGRADWFTDETFDRLTEHPLEALETEYPHHARPVEGPEDTFQPSEQHPVFYGCYDWHSAVHSHWSLVRQLRLADEHPESEAITESIDSRLTSENVATEVEVFEASKSFEKPYGWGWLLRLAAELQLWDDPRANRWIETLAPLETRIVELVESEFLPQSRPFRVGTHGNSAFALGCVLDYARVVENDDLAVATEETAQLFYADDEDAPVAYEPLGWDFFSPTLTEGTLMARVLEEEFEAWLDDFLPDVAALREAGFLDPVDVGADSGEGIELHLVGLNVSKAWGLASLADAVGDHGNDELQHVFASAAERHLDAGVSMAFTDDYAGSHWLSSFVLFLLTRNEGGIGV